MNLPPSFPEPNSLVERFRTNENTRKSVLHNASVLRSVHGGLEMVRANRRSFDPRRDYWRLPERRVLVAYFAKKWGGRVAPAAAVRAMAISFFTHFDRARAEGGVRYVGVDYASVGGWAGICDALIAHAGRLPPLPEFPVLKQVWGRDIAGSAAEDLETFLRQTHDLDSWWQKHEPIFKQRLPWMAYLGVSNVDELLRSQRFFFGYANLMTTTNAYRFAGAQSFASVLQNTPTDDVLKNVDRWEQGETPLQTGFVTFNVDDDDEQPRNRAEYSSVVELYGFLSLHRSPYYNNLADVYRQWLDVPRDVSQYALSAHVGEVTRAWLAINPEGRAALAKLFRELLDSDIDTPIRFEDVVSERAAARAGQKDDALADGVLRRELSELAGAKLRKYSEEDSAACALHLLLDSEVYRRSLTAQSTPAVAVVDTPAAQSAVSLAAERGSAQQPPQPMEMLTLPTALRDAGARALAYLHAGLHVLFAGAPGTGKTTLAQFVGYAWNKGLRAVPVQIPIEEAPLTTVGNAAWSPFHTVGGLMPRRDGGFEAHAGIFIDPASTSQSLWRLRNGAIVLDEMNRADLDRCIGELYPLLSGSVRRVHPAGIPLVKTVEASDRFRIIATVNDGTIDDIVFPISEGLARRFQRIELPGASQEDVEAFVCVGSSAVAASRSALAQTSIKEFFSAAADQQYLISVQEENRLPFGVGYFALLRSWVSGVLEMPAGEQTDAELATDLLIASLTTVAKSKQLTGILRKLRSPS